MLFPRDIPFQNIKHSLCHTVLWMLMMLIKWCDSRVKAEGKRATTNTGSYTDVPSKPLLWEEKGEKMTFSHQNMTTICQKRSWQQEKLMKSGHTDGSLWIYSVFVLTLINETLICFFLLSVYICVCTSTSSLSVLS